MAEGGQWQREPVRSRRCYAAALALSLGALAAAYWLPEGGVPWLECRFRRWTGLPCPTCGYTRGVQAVLHGKVGQAMLDCPAAILAAAALVVTAVGSALALVRGRPWGMVRDPEGRSRWMQRWAVVGLVVVVANWLWRLARGLV